MREDGLEMRIVTWNLQKMSRPEIWDYFFDEPRPDIGLLQEVKPNSLQRSGFRPLRAGLAVFASSGVLAPHPMDELLQSIATSRVGACQLNLTNLSIIVVNTSS